MKIQVQCSNPDCRTSYKVDESQLGMSATCRRCGQEFLVTNSASPYPVSAETRSRKESDHKAIPPAASGSRQDTKRLGRFQLGTQLGAGGFGAVYRAYDPILEREVALKVPRAAVLQKPEAKARFLREPKAAARLQHPHIVPVFDAGTDGESYYIASAYIVGKTLQDTIVDERLRYADAARIIRDLATALFYAHGKGIVHRDVKPANVMIDQDGQPLLMDFGIAHLEESDEKLTRDGSVIGTPAYMAPEQADQSFGAVGPASDQYALGVVLYELLCGSAPFSGPANVVIYNLVHQDPKSLRAADPDIPRDLETICLKAMAKRQHDRYADCGCLAEDLRRWLADEPIRASRPSVIERVRRWRRKNPALAWSSAAALLLTLVASLSTFGYLAASRAHYRELLQRHGVELRLNAAESSLQGAESGLRAAETDLQQAMDELRLISAELELAKTEEASEATQRRRETIEAEVARAQERYHEAQARLTVAKQRSLATWSSNRDHRAPINRRVGIAAINLGQPVKPPDLLPGSVDPAPPAPPEGTTALSAMALTTHPAQLEGLRSWTVETLTHRGRVNCVAYSPDGRMLATAGEDGTVRLWRVTDASLLRVLYGHMARPIKNATLTLVNL